MSTVQWWHGMTIYHVYPRSFADGNGDGIGDLRGLIDRLDYVVGMGFDTLWVSPFFASPQHDYGYDISDYYRVAPEYGTLADADELIAACHRRQLRIVFDLVLNHTSDQHPWFRESCRSRDNPKADWYIWRDGRGREGRRPPNNWRSNLEVRSAWQWSGRRGQWYLASFLPWQPDLNWHNPQVRHAMFDVARFWLDRGVDGFRLDLFGTVMKDHAFRDNPLHLVSGGGDIPHLWRRVHNENTEDNFALARELRTAVNTAAPPERVLLGEVFGTPDVVRRYLGEHDGLHLVFLFEFLMFDYDVDFFRDKIGTYEAAFPAPAQPTYVVENHDQSRSLNRLGGDLRKAQVLAVILLTLRGVVCVYQGQELGLPNTYIPLREARDPIVHEFFSWVPEAVSRRMRRRINRDEMRTPMPWDDSPGHGFCPPGVVPWLPIGDGHGHGRDVANERAVPGSLLNLYRRLLWLRREADALRTGELRLCPKAPRNVLAYERCGDDQRYVVLANLGQKPARVRLPAAADTALTTDAAATVAGHEARLPAHTAVVARYR
ncbi:MAG: DUF3459 domain-containing protein [Streptosporangiales bacterium]|nr:DUF3459 domain-containing protein [Streptosporangiales bacterium]